jgi:hypothetical protein
MWLVAMIVICHQSGHRCGQRRKLAMQKMDVANQGRLVGKE